MLIEISMKPGHGKPQVPQSPFHEDCKPDVIFLSASLFSIVSSRSRYRKPVVKYPKDTQFWVTDFFVKGCKNFIEMCPKAYKYQHICARSYDGDYKDFANYCFMQYENCNTWRNWHVFKRERC